jgi:PKD repeat protein
VAVEAEPAPAPTADFTYTANYLSVQFTDRSTNPVYWEWDFGDLSGTVTDQSPSHTYASAGAYTITLTIFNSDHSASDTKTLSITVEAEPLADTPTP